MGIDTDILSTQVAMDNQRMRRMAPNARMEVLKGAVEEGADFLLTYDHICSIVDPMDVMSDGQIFGAEIPRKYWDTSEPE